ncbi:hypothetical protein [Priestia megaterium]|uniref:hypothetical protein n=1 Tax=Priestia megaterium TaxID=1404 RepID=UPI000BFBE620|nr:hypothetical protein [Priestia megaterium]PGO60611.1 hypothetical protein CN981_08665 [Priestia megaterium]
MKVMVSSTDERKIEVGDIIEFEHTKSRRGREHGFYMISHSEHEGYFLISLTGQKTRLKFYNSLTQLLNNQNEFKNIYSKHDWKINLTHV